MAESSATLKIVIADDPSASKPTGRPPVGTEPAGPARELASGGRKSSASVGGGVAGGGSNASFNGLAKALGLTAKELRQKADEPGIRELIEQLRDTEQPNETRENAKQDRVAEGRQKAEKPDINPIDEAIDEVFERFRKGLLSLEEAQSRLDRFAKSEKVTDLLRDRGEGHNVKDVLDARLKKEAADKGQQVPTRLSDLIDKHLPKEVQSLLDEIPGVGRALAILDKFGPVVEKFFPGLGGKSATPNVARAAASGSEAAGVARTVAKAAPAAAEAGAGAEAGAAVGAGEAGVAAAGLGELAAVAGPVGAALLVAKLSADHLAGNFDKLREGVKFAGDAMSGLARNELMGTFKEGTEKAAQSMEKTSIIGKVYAAEIRAFSQTVQSARQTLDAFAARGRELAQYDARTALASSRSDVASIRADIREARELGPDYGRIIDARREIDTEMRDIMLEFKKAVLPLVASVAESGSEVVHAIGPAVQESIKTISEGIQVMANAASAAKKLSGIELILKTIHGIIGDTVKKEQRKVAKTAYEQIHEMAEQLGKEEKKKPDPIDVAASQRLNIPILS